jgi:tight adherence protein B
MDRITGVSLTVGLGIALLVWLVFDLGVAAWHRYRARFDAQATVQAQSFFLSWDTRQLFAANLALMLGGSLLSGLWSGSIWIACATAGGLAYAPQWAYGLLRQRRLRRFEEQLPDALLMLSAGIRAGAGLSAAIGQTAQEAQAPLSQEFQLMLREQRLGVSIDQSLAHLNQRIPTPSTTLVVSAMRIAQETGGGLAETLERAAHTLRTRLQMEGKIGALTAQGKLQAWVVGLLPVLLLAVLDQMEPQAMALLWHTPVGWAVLGAIAFLEGMGIYLIRRIVAIDV